MLPIERGRWFQIDRSERTCNLCNMSTIGDEFHYILECPYFENDRKNIPSSFHNRPNAIKLQSLFCTKRISTLKKLCNFIRVINDKVSPPTL